MAEKKQPQYIIRVKASNIKNVRLVDFRPNRYVTKVSGANGAGKTSTLDAIMYGLAGTKTLPANLIRQGERNGEILLETNTHIIKRRLDERGGGVLIEVKESRTLVKDPADWLRMMAGNLGFDPLKFKHMKPDEQYQILKGIVKLDADVDDLDEKNATDALIIRDRNREFKFMKDRREKIAVDDTLPREPIDIEALFKDSRAIALHNSEIEKTQRERSGQESERKVRLDNIAGWNRQIARLQRELVEAEAGLKDESGKLEALNKAIEAWEPLPDLKDRFAIDNQITNASSTNSQITSNNAKRDEVENLDKEIDALDAEIDNLKAIVSDRKKTVAKALENAKFPIPGLSFTYEEVGAGGRELTNPKRIVTYYGLPLEDASTGEQIRVSAAIGMAGNPELKVMVIHEGSLLDEKGMEILEQMAAETGCQMLVEVVDTSGKVGVYLEDGEIKAINEEPEPVAPKATKKKKTQETTK